MDKIVLKNVSKTTFHGQLDHDVVCRRTGLCTCTQVPVRTANGKVTKRKDPAGFAIVPGAGIELPAAALYLDPVRSACAAGRLVVVAVASADAPKTPVTELPDARKGRGSKVAAPAVAE